MTKQDFLLSLQGRLSKYIPKTEVKERLSFYDEMINDLIEEGLSEAEAVSKIGSVDDIVSQILTELPPDKIIQDGAKKKRKFLEIAILAISSPLWASLLIAGFAIVLALYISMWAIVASLWSVVLSFVVFGTAGIIYAPFLFVTGNYMTGALAFAMSFVLLGLLAFAYYGCMQVSKWAIILTKTMIKYLKGFFADKERGKNE